MIIRPAEPADFAAIHAIQAASPEAAQWDPASYLCCVAVEEGEVAGFLVTRETAPGEREILNLAVAPGKRRRGVARGLLEHELLRAPGVWFLEVRESNRAATALYESLGFRVAGKRPEYYANPVETGIVMRFFS